MSQFLGPIHHWIFAQVCLCESRGEVLSRGLQDKYGDEAVECWNSLKGRFPGQFEGADLEELLAGQGIHPALDAMIATVQSREAGLIAWGLEQAEGADTLRELFSSDGSAWGEKLRAAGKGSTEPRA
ncbi:MAG: hypothetical protein QGG80_06035, partial [Candidatus Krumholzibacteria bacterium]|nr:hypothetical protein [Candidatus Krumholzibacteria bacterium]